MAPFQDDRTQFPIGQGGFHSMALYSDSGRTFSMVVDCGGSTVQHRRVLAKAFAERECRHDFLAISHLDDDHINGLEDLKDAGVSFGTVFLPHVDMNSYLKWMTLKLSASAGANSGSILTGFSKTAALLYGGNFGPVVLVGDPEEGEGGENNRDIGEDGGDDRVLTNGARQAIESAKGAGARLSCSTSLTFDLDWLIRFYSREWKFPSQVASIWNMKLLQGLQSVISSTKADPTTFDWEKFRDDLNFELKKKADKSLASELESLVPPTDSRAPTLKELEKKVATGKISCKQLLSTLYRITTSLHDYNDASMCVYSGPAERGIGVRRRCFDHLVHSGVLNARERNNTRAVGWVHTGDANFTDEARLKDFLDHYITEISLTSVLVLPHHGSRRSFDPAMLRLRELAACLAKPTMFLAPAKPQGKYRHPDGDVVHTCYQLGNLTIVDEDAASYYSESATTVWPWGPYWDM